MRWIGPADRWQILKTTKSAMQHCYIAGIWAAERSCCLRPERMLILTKSSIQGQRIADTWAADETEAPKD